MHSAQIAFFKKHLKSLQTLYCHLDKSTFYDIILSKRRQKLKQLTGKIKEKAFQKVEEDPALHITEKTDLQALQYHPIFKSKSYCGNVVVQNVDASNAPISKLEEVDCDVLIENSKVESMLGNIKKNKYCTCNWRFQNWHLKRT